MSDAVHARRPAPGEGRLTVDDVVRYVRHPWALELSAQVREALVANAAVAEAAVERGEAYGRTTGVGANRDTVVESGDGDHGLRLVRSHAAGAGPDLGADVARATMLVRAHQLSLPGSGIPAEVVEALVAAANDGRSPIVRRYGGVGTGDITVLGELALCLLGEMPWRGGTTESYLPTIGANAALALMSSSAPTLAIAALAVDELRTVARASLVAAVLTGVVVRATGQQWSEVAADVRPSPGVGAATRAWRALVDGTPVSPPRTQDPFGWRTAPYAIGALLDAVDEAAREVEACINAGIENPRFADGRVVHHGGFYLLSLSLKLDALRAAVAQCASLSITRLVKLHDPSYTGAGRFLAVGPRGSNGTMVLEYAAASALEEARGLADPVTRGSVSLSLGNEDAAPWTWRAAQATGEIAEPMRVVVACELVAAVRALRMTIGAQFGPGVREALDACRALPDQVGDRPLVADIATAVAALPALASLSASGGWLTDR